MSEFRKKIMVAPGMVGTLAFVIALIIIGTGVAIRLHWEAVNPPADDCFIELMCGKDN